MRCIVCLERDPKCGFNKEHVFPDALAGNALKIRSVCVDCNSTFGSNVDTWLTDHLFMRFERLNRGLSGKEGHLPNPLENSVMADDPQQKLRYEFDGQGRPKRLYVVPKVTKQEKTSEQNESHQAVFDRSDINAAKKFLNKRLKEHGKPPLTPEQTEVFLAGGQMEIDNIEIEVQHGSTTNPDAIARLALDTIRYNQGLLKIAYELAWYWLGEAFLDDPVAATIRECLAADADAEDWEDLYFSKVDCQSRITGVQTDAHWPGSSDHHVAFIDEYGGHLLVYIRIFDRIEAFVTVSHEPEKYPECRRQFVSINPGDPNYRETTLDEAVDHDLYIPKPNEGQGGSTI